MIELRKDILEFSFPEVHPKAKLNISLLRTLRVPDDGNSYPLPAGLGRFPIRHVDDYSTRIPEEWVAHGGVMMPMYQAEAMWINFGSEEIANQAPYPFAVKVLTGKVCAVSGESYRSEFSTEPQNYLVVPEQRWIDGFCVGNGKVRQFVAAGLGDGYTAEEQVTGLGEFGGIQLVVSPMKREVFEELYPPNLDRDGNVVMYHRTSKKSAAMGIAAGGELRQSILKDPYGLDVWEQDTSSRCFIHILNSTMWRHATGLNPPCRPFTRRKYQVAGIPWFQCYADEFDSLEPEPALAQLASLGALMKSWKGKKLDDNKSFVPETVINLRTKNSDQVRESEF